MKYLWVFILAVSPSAFAQGGGNVFYQSQGAGTVVTFGEGGRSPVQGAPYSATITNESIQTLGDGNRIVQTSTGTTARDSQGRTRQDTALPAIGNLSAANAPHLVFIQDPVAQTSYTLNLTDKTAQKMPMFYPGAIAARAADKALEKLRTQGVIGAGAAVGDPPFNVQIPDPGPISIPSPPLAAINAAGVALPPGIPPTVTVQRFLGPGEQGQAKTESLGSQNMEGVFVNGVRTTRTIPAGQIGNDRPIEIVTEVWTSPDLNTVVYSKRSDPRTGEQTFRLTNINRSEPDPSLFSVPADFKITEGPKPILFQTNQ